MTPDNLGEVEHRHLSPLIGFFPGDRITVDDSPQDIVTGVRNLLVARGIAPYGWANAWRALCWSRFRDGERAYQMITTNLQSSTGSTSGTALNFFDVWPLDANSSIFQIEANFGTPAAMVDMLLYSQPGRIELLPALPAAWADRGRITGAGARGGFSIDFAWRRGRVTECVVHSTGGGTTQVIANGVTRTVRTRPGKSVTLRW
jgi:alpha-L-fucosidase 2